MKKTFLIMICLVIFVCPIFAENNDTTKQPDFRKTFWGATINEVLNSEPIKPFSQSSSRLFYETTINGFPSMLVYEFINGKLANAYYIFNQSHTNQNDFISDFMALKELLKKKYGEPIKDDVIWKNELYKDDVNHWGLAVSMGHLFYETKWETERTIIRLVLTGDNFEITLGVTYYNKINISTDDKNEDLENM